MIVPFIFLFVLVFPVGIFCLVFWLWMLIDAIQHQAEDKLMWVVLIVVLPLIGSVLYFFMAKQKRTELKIEGKKINSN